MCWIRKWWQRRKDLLYGELVDGFGPLPLYEQLVPAHALLVSYFRTPLLLDTCYILVIVHFCNQHVPCLQTYSARATSCCRLYLYLACAMSCCRPILSTCHVLLQTVPILSMCHVLLQTVPILSMCHVLLQTYT